VPTGVTHPVLLPLAGQRRERGDAAANRQRILDAARELLTRRGVSETTMDAVACAAGVGKGTLFRRFGDRAGLMEALLDDSMRAFQDAFLSGPPPLGPGAPASVRLEAFVDELLRLMDTQLDLSVAADRAAAAGTRMRLHGALALHVRALLAEIDPSLDAEVVADLLLGAIAAGVVHHLRRERDVDLPAVQSAARALLRGLTCGAEPADRRSA
jgi:AcrR family transcriptional regulator